MIEIYTKQDCSYCVKAKELLTQRGILYKEYRIPEDVSAEWVKYTWPGAKTVPVVVIDDKWIGGFEELSQYTQPHPASCDEGDVEELQHLEGLS